MPIRWILLLVVLFFVLTSMVAVARAVWQVRRRRVRLPDPPLHVDFSVAELQDLRDRGQLTPQEFERARTIVLRRAQERDAEADRSRGHAFQVIQKALPADQPPPPLPPPAPPSAGDEAGGGDGSRDAR